MGAIDRRLSVLLVGFAMACGAEVGADEGAATGTSSEGTSATQTSAASVTTTSASTTTSATTTSSTTTAADSTDNTTTVDETETSGDVTSSTGESSSDGSSTGGAGEIYASFDQFVTWDQSRAACESRGGTLATIHSDAENSAVFDVCEETTGGVGPDTGCWIGLAMPYDTWEDESAVDFENWSRTNPDGNGDCVWLYIQAALGSPAEWDDYLCDWETSFVCRLPADGDVDGAAAVMDVP